MISEDVQMNSCHQSMVHKSLQAKTMKGPEFHKDNKLFLDLEIFLSNISPTFEINTKTYLSRLKLIKIKLITKTITLYKPLGGKNQSSPYKANKLECSSTD